MDTDLIVSQQNSIVKFISSLKLKKYRDIEKKFVIEGDKFVNEIPSDWEIDFYAISESYANTADINKLQKRSKIYYLKDSVYSSISDTKNPQGIMAVCHQKDYNMSDILSEEKLFIIILEEINDPGNLGSIIRTADAGGASGILLSSGCAEVYNPKVLRSTAGSVFHIPFVYSSDLNKELIKLRDNNVKLIATHLNGKTVPYDVNMKDSIALMIGNEARGITQETAEMADYLVKLPMIGKAESLNASVAGGIMIYEVIRQRLNNS